MNTKLLVAALSLTGALSVSAAEREPVDWVNTEIGTISHLLVPCFRTVQLPNAMLRFLPPYRDYTSVLPLEPSGNTSALPLEPSGNTQSVGGSARGPRVNAVVSAPKASKDAKYWDAATLGGKPIAGTVLRHEDILAGKTLTLEMHE